MKSVKALIDTFPRDTARPFSSKTAELPWTQWLKIGVNWLLIVPFKLACALTLLLIAVLVMSVATAGMSAEDQSKPMAAWRMTIKSSLHGLVRAFLWCIGFLWIPTSGKCAPRSEAPIVVSNHVSFSDPIALMAQLLASAVAAAEFKNLPGFGFLMAGTQCIFVDRKDPNSRALTREALLARAGDDRWPRVLMFPEATTTNQEALLRFKPGAFVAGLPVQPVVIRQPFQFSDPSWVSGGPGLGGMWFRLLGQFAVHMSIEYLPVYHPSKEEKADPELYAENVRHRMALALGVPASQLSQDDVPLASRAAARQYPVDHATLGVFQFRQLGIKPRQLLPLVDAFIDLDAAQQGTVAAQAAVAGRGGEAPASPLLATLTGAFAGRGGGMDMHAWMLLHILLAGRAPGGWTATAAALREAAAASAGADGFVHALQDATGSTGQATWEGFEEWATHDQAAWRRLVQTWLPSGAAMDGIWAQS